MNAKGRVFKYGDNVDTDVIIPARYLNTASHAELAAHCMEDIDKDFVKKAQPGDIIVATKNFGCGSSREQAPIALKQRGVSLIMAKGFARIFRRNSINIGLPVWAADLAGQVKTGDLAEVDLEQGKVTVNGVEYTFPPLAENVLKTLAYGGLIPRVRAELGME